MVVLFKDFTSIKISITQKIYFKEFPYLMLVTYVLRIFVQISEIWFLLQVLSHILPYPDLHFADSYCRYRCTLVLLVFVFVQRWSNGGFATVSSFFQLFSSATLSSCNEYMEPAKSYISRTKRPQAFNAYTEIVERLKYTPDIVTFLLYFINAEFPFF